MATLIGDLVGSRRVDDRQRLHATLTEALERVNARIRPWQRLQVTAGDEFQGTFGRLGQALDAALLIQLELLSQVDVRFGLGWGEITVLDPEAGTQDGPGWWSARGAIEWVKETSEQAALRHVRTAYRRSGDHGPGQEAVSAALLCRDQMLGSLDERSLRILRGLMAERTQSELAAEEGVSPSAVSQRVRTDGLAIILQASRWLREVR